MIHVRSTRVPRALGARAAIGAALSSLALLGSCRAVDARAWNLDQLHDSEGRHHYRAALEGRVEYFFRHVLATMIAGTKASLAQKSPGEVDDPSGACLGELLELEKLDASDRYTRARTIEWCARLAVEDRATLSRERALYALARAAAPLGRFLPIALPKDRTPAGAEAVGHALSTLVNSARPVLGLAAWDETARADFEASLALVRGLDLDLAGARRALRVGCDLAERAGWTNGRTRGLTALVEELERTCVSRSIARALADDEPVVQSAAIEASESVAGRGVLAGLLFQGAQQVRTPPLVLERILARLAQGGLVREAAEPGAPPPAELVEQQLDALCHIAVQREEPEVRVAAMLTLSAVSGAGFQSLREEDWKAWWELRQPRKSAGEAHP